MTRVILFITLVALPVGSLPAAEPERFFEEKVRPILADHCFGCHGPKKQMAGLRLDTRPNLLKGGDNGPVVKPGQPERSPLILAIRQSGDLKMPPKKKLTSEAITILTQWVQAGAPWPETKTVAIGENSAQAWKKHWAYQPIAAPPLPATHRPEWIQTSIDAFVLAKLEGKGLAPSPAADRRTLLRRVTFDLIGLPPTPTEMAAFEADQSPNAFAKVVERLLASPHYGERWGRHWLDVARYADNKGYVFLQESKFGWAWTYRDYVVRSFNQDLSFDQFVIQQLAADHLQPRDPQTLTAMGFLTVGGRFMNNIHDILDDRIDVVTRGLMGLTVSCARCHDHKFDPIPTKDYYSLYGVFASSVEPVNLPLIGEAPKTAEFAAYEKELNNREQQITDFLQAKRIEVSSAAKTRVAEYMLKSLTTRRQPNTSSFMLIADDKDLNPKMLARWQNYLEATVKPHHRVFAPWHKLASLPAENFESEAAQYCQSLATLDSKQPINRMVAKSFSDQAPKSIQEAAQRYGAILNQADQQWRDTLKQAEMAKQPAPMALPDADQEELRQVFYSSDSPPNIAYRMLNDLALLPDRPSQDKLRKLRAAVETWRATGPGAPPRALVLEDAPALIQPKVFLRGNPNTPGETVPRRFPAVVAGEVRQPFQHGSGRLDLAQAIVDRRNPLTARVLVNRVWLHHFGSAIVRTPSDFGVRSEPPTHPELLDHLATQLISENWSIKQLHRRIVLSAAYQQASAERDDAKRVDPENTLLWRMNRNRLDFEATRDALLMVSGRLDPTVGGPTMNDLVSSGSNRRTLYGFIDRLNLPGLFRTFDFPFPDTTNPQRDVTTVPQQALFFMNHPFMRECAQRLLQRPEVAAANDPSSKIDQIYLLAYDRRPSAQERALADEFLNPMNHSPAAWEQYAQSILMANEFAFVD